LDRSSAFYERDFFADLEEDSREVWFEFTSPVYDGYAYA